MKSIVALILLTVTAPIGLSQIRQVQNQNSIVASPEARIGWLEQWRRSTVSFGTIERDATQREYYKVVGSGIVVAVDSSTAYIVTAKHVFYNPSKNWHPARIQIRFGWQDQASVYDDHGAALVLRNDSGDDLWTALSDGSDIAAIRAPTAIMPNQPAVSPEVVAKPEEVFEGASLIVLGYPGIVGNEYLVRAISRGGIVAWLNPHDAMGSVFLIDSNIYPGNSGGPVIKVPSGINKGGGFQLGGRASLLGIVVEAPGQSGDFELTVPGQLLPLRIHEEVPVGGTGVVEPASKILKLLDLLKADKK